jgi:hypothetical protein
VKGCAAGMWALSASPYQNLTHPISYLLSPISYLLFFHLL